MPLFSNNYPKFLNVLKCTFRIKKVKATHTSCFLTIFNQMFCVLPIVFASE